MAVNRQAATVETIKKILEVVEETEVEYASDSDTVSLKSDEWDRVVKAATSSLSTLLTLLRNNSAGELRLAIEALTREKADVAADLKHLQATQDDLCDENRELVNKLQYREEELNQALTERNDYKKQVDTVKARLRAATDMMESMLGSRSPRTTHGDKVEDSILTSEEEGFL